MSYSSGQQKEHDDDFHDNGHPIEEGAEWSSTSKIGVYAALFSVLGAGVYKLSNSELDRKITAALSEGTSNSAMKTKAIENARKAYESGDYINACLFALGILETNQQDAQKIIENIADHDMFMQLTRYAQESACTDPIETIDTIINNARQSFTNHPDDKIAGREEIFSSMLAQNGPEAKIQIAKKLATYVKEVPLFKNTTPSSLSIRQAYWEAAKNLVSQDPSFSVILALRALMQRENDSSAQQFQNEIPKNEYDQYFNQLALSFTERMVRAIDNTNLNHAANMAKNLLDILERTPFTVETTLDVKIDQAARYLEVRAVPHQAELIGNTCYSLAGELQRTLKQRRNDEHNTLASSN